MNKIVQCFLNADLRSQHTGLTEIAKKEKVDPSSLKPGEHLIFINANQNKMKMLSAGNVLTYLSLPKGRIDLNTIKYLPSMYGKNLEIKYNKAIRKVLQDNLKPKGKFGKAKAVKAER